MDFRTVEQQRGFSLVWSEVGDRREQIAAKRLRGRGVEDRDSTSSMRFGKSPGSGLQWNLQLTEKDRIGRDIPDAGLQLVNAKPRVSCRRDNDEVLSARKHKDAGGAARSRRPSHATVIDVGGLKTFNKQTGKIVVAQFANHSHRAAQTPSCDSLVGAFAAGNDNKIAPEDRLTGLRQAREWLNEVGIQAAYNNDPHR